MEITEVTIKNVLTRTTGYLKTVTSHSLQPYRGCTFGKSLCGVGCYVQHNRHLLNGRPWGGFLDVRTNAAQSYRDKYHRERSWAHRDGGRFSIFCSSATEPFLPQESRYGITRSILESMCDLPPDELILQTHSHLVVEQAHLIAKLTTICQLRVHLSIESDRDSLPGLPPHASSIEYRFSAARELKKAGIPVVITVSPLLPIENPEQFFARIAEVADGVVIDHFILGDGSADGSRTRRTPLPEAMAAVDRGSVDLTYRDRMIAIARRHLPGQVGISIDGFAGRYL